MRKELLINDFFNNDEISDWDLKRKSDKAEISLNFLI